MNRKVPIAAFHGQDDLRLYSIGLDINCMGVYRGFDIPLVINDDEEFIIRINKDGATLESAKREA